MMPCVATCTIAAPGASARKRASVASAPAAAPRSARRARHALVTSFTSRRVAGSESSGTAPFAHGVVPARSPGGSRTEVRRADGEERGRRTRRCAVEQVALREWKAHQRAALGEPAAVAHRQRLPRATPADRRPRATRRSRPRAPARESPRCARALALARATARAFGRRRAPARLGRQRASCARHAERSVSSARRCAELDALRRRAVRARRARSRARVGGGEQFEDRDERLAGAKNGAPTVAPAPARRARRARARRVARFRRPAPWRSSPRGAPTRCDRSQRERRARASWRCASVQRARGRDERRVGGAAPRADDAA